MKKIGYLFICIMLLLSLAGCGQEREDEEELIAYTYEIGMLTLSPDVSIDDGNYTEAVWEGVRRYAEEAGVTYKYYEPAANSAESRLTRLDEAIGEGVKVVVAAGPEMGETIFKAQEKYPEIKFIYVDGVPVNGAGETRIGDNCVCITFDAVQAGFLAGYGAVLEGLDDLAFLADGESEEAREYGYGFLQGCNEAAMNYGRYAVINYSYGSEDASKDQICEKAKKWYEEGTDAVFTYGAEVFNAVKKEAEATKKVVIASNVSHDYSKTVITSGKKYYQEEVSSQLAAVYDGNFSGGETRRVDLKEKRVGLDMDASKFQYFNEKMYKDVCDRITDGELKILSPKDKDAENIEDLVKAKWMYYIRIQEQ